MNSNEYQATISNRQTWLANSNFVKTVLMIMVVVGHATDFWSGTWFTVVKIQSTRLALIPEWIGSFHIYGFTLVSGFIFAYLQRRSHYGSLGVLVESLLIKSQAVNKENRGG